MKQWIRKDVYKRQLGKVLHHKDFVTDLAVWTEIDIWVFTAGRTHIVKLDLFQGTLTGSRLFGLGSVGTESGNKLLKFFDLFFFLLVGFLHLFDEEPVSYTHLDVYKRQQ